MSDMVLVERRGTVARLTLNRPASRNSLSREMLDRLYASVSTLGAANDVHVIIIAANGPAFCAGHDLKELTHARDNADGGRAFFEETMANCSRLMQAIVACPKPVIAEVHGVATAAGCQMVASCDLAVAADTARFATPGVHIGLFCSTPMVALSRNVGRKAAMKMLLTGEMMDANAAQQIGLVNDVVSSDSLSAAVDDLAQQIASKSPAVMTIGKEAFYQQIEMTLPDAYHYASEAMVLNMLDPESAEGIAAFLEKRMPIWQPREAKAQ